MNISNDDPIFRTTTLLQDIDLELEVYTEVVGNKEDIPFDPLEHIDWIKHLTNKVKLLIDCQEDTDIELQELKKVSPEMHDEYKKDLCRRVNQLKKDIAPLLERIDEKNELLDLGSIVNELFASFSVYGEERDRSHFSEVKLLDNKELEKHAKIRSQALKGFYSLPESMTQKKKFDPSDLGLLTKMEAETIYEPLIENTHGSTGLKRVLKKILPRYFNLIKERINQELFATWGEKVKIEKQKKKIEKLQKDHDKTKEKMDMLASKLDDESLDKFSDLTRDFTIKRNKIKALQKKVVNFEKKQAKGIEARYAFSKIGAVPLKLQSQDKTKIDGMFLSAQAFKSTIKDDGGKIVSLQTEKNSPIKGFAFNYQDFEKEEEHILEHLDILKATSTIHQKTGEYKQGGGLTKVYVPSTKEHPQAQILLLPDKELSSLLKEGVIYAAEGKNNTMGFMFNPDYTDRVNYSEIDTKQKSNGLVIQSTSNLSQYEREKETTMIFLLEYGMDVMMYNFRGYGESEGKPNKSNSFQDIETVYQYVHDTLNYEDEKIVLYGYCLGGGPSAHLAKRHPKTNLLLVNSTSNLPDCVSRLTEMEIDKIISKIDKKDQILFKDKIKRWFLDNNRMIAKCVAKLATPGIHTAQYIKDVEGNIAVIRADKDDVVTSEDVQRYRKIADKKNLSLEIYEVDGEHDFNWYDTDPVDGKQYDTLWDEKLNLKREGRKVVGEFFNKCQVGGSIFE